MKKNKNQILTKEQFKSFTTQKVEPWVGGLEDAMNEMIALTDNLDTGKTLYLDVVKYDNPKNENFECLLGIYHRTDEMISSLKELQKELKCFV